MDYCEFAPAPELRPFVRCFWTLRGSGAGAAEPVVPDGSFEIIIHLGEPFVQTREHTASVQPQSLLIAELRRPVTVTPSSRVDVVAVRFRPGCAWLFLEPPLDRLEGEVHALDDLWPARQLRETVGHADDDAQRIGILENELIRRLRETDVDESFQQSIAWMRRSAGSVRVEQLASRAGVSSRQLERQFLNKVGVPPKLFGRLLRFNRVVQEIRQSPRTWLQNGLAGYYDQSHLIRDFRAFAGMTPTEFVSRSLPLNDAFTELANSG